MHKEIEREAFVWVDMEIDNFEYFEQVIKDWSIDFNQLDGGKFYSKLEQMILPQIQVGQTHFDCHIDQKGKSPHNMWSFVILGENSSMFKFNHIETKDTSTMLIYSPSQEINAVSRPGFHVYILSVEDVYLKKIALSLGLDNIEEKLAKIDRIELGSQQADSLREQLKNLLKTISLMDNKVFTTQEKEILFNTLPIQFLKNIHLHAGCSPKKIFKSKHILFMNIRAYMHTHFYEQITVRSIAKKFKVTERTLLSYFRNELEISPKQYLTIIRLHKVRDSLTHTTKNNKNIEQTARNFGFTHMGFFSQNYKGFFGELPSETLRII